MITQTTLKKQVGRILRLPFSPSDPEDLKGLAEEFQRVLKKYCSTDEHCEAAVTALMDTAKRVPSPAEIIDAINSVPNPADKGPDYCDICREYRGLIPIPGFYASVRYCTCPGGAWLKERHAKYYADQERKRR